MKVDVAGLIAAAQRLIALATSMDGVQGSGPGEHPPLALDTTSGGAAARLEAASMQLWGSACAQANALHTAAAHLVMIAAKFGGQEEINAAGLTMLLTPVSVLDGDALAALAPVPPIAPDSRLPLPPLQPDLTGELFSQMVTAGSPAAAVGFGTTATSNGVAVESAALAVREVVGSVPELWDSPVGTAALSGRLLEHANALRTIADRWFELADESRRHADDYSQTVAAVPKPQEFKQNEAQLRRAQADKNGIAVSQLIQQRGVLQERALAEAQRYAGVTETSTSPTALGSPQGQPPGTGAAAGAPGAGAAAAPAQAPPATAAAGAQGSAQAGQAGDSAGQLAQLLPAALGAIGGLAGGAAGMVGQVPQALIQTGQGLAQTASQGLTGLASQKPAEAELATSVRGLAPDELSKANAGGGAGGGGGAGDTHPAGALGPPVTPSTSHTAPTVPAGAAAPPAPTPAGGSAMGGMPMGGLMPHGGQGGDAGGNKVPADKKVVVPPQPHTEPVTGRVSDRTAAAAEASRARAESNDPDDEPPRGPVLRRITLAPLHDEGP